MESECNPFHQSAVTPGSVTALATRVGSSPGYERPAAQAVQPKQHRNTAHKPGVQPEQRKVSLDEGAKRIRNFIGQEKNII